MRKIAFYFFNSGSHTCLERKWKRQISRKSSNPKIYFDFTFFLSVPTSLYSISILILLEEGRSGYKYRSKRSVGMLEEFL